ncbi:MAG: hypothetical protein WAW31_10130 [Smithella sp.]|jgi:hypothetical protein
MDKTVKQIKQGRPPKSNQKEIKDAICHLISTTTYGLRKITELLHKEIDNAPDLSTIMWWLIQDKNFSEQYAQAKESQCDLFAEELIDIADDSSSDEIFTEDGKRIANKEFINRSRLRVDTRKWLLSKLKAKKYGDYIKSDVTVQGELNVRSMSDAELNARVAQELKTLKR